MSRRAAKTAKKLRLERQVAEPPKREKPIPPLELSDLADDFDLACSLLRVQLEHEWVLRQGTQPLLSREFAKGLIGVLTYKFPKHKEVRIHRTAPVPMDHIQAWGQPEDELFQLALDNLRDDGLIEHREVPHPEGFVLEYVKEDFNHFGGSQVLFLEKYLDPLPSAGVVLGVPTDSEVMFVRMDGPRLELALNYLVWIVPEICMESYSGASPHIYWWRDGALSYLTSCGAGGPWGRVNYTLPPEFLEVYNDLIQS